MIQNRSRLSFSKTFAIFFKKNKTEYQNPSTTINHSSFFLPIRLFLFILIICFIILAVVFKKLPPAIPLYYSLPWGEDQLAKPSDLFIIPFSLILIFLLNLVLSLTFLKKDPFLTKFLIWNSCFVALAGLITLIKIIFLII